VLREAAEPRKLRRARGQGIERQDARQTLLAPVLASFVWKTYHQCEQRAEPEFVLA